VTAVPLMCRLAHCHSALVTEVYTHTAVMLVIVTTAITQVMSGTANLSHALKNVINFTKRKMLDTRNMPHHSCVAAHAWK